MLRLPSCGHVEILKFTRIPGPNIGIPRHGVDWMIVCIFFFSFVLSQGIRLVSLGMVLHSSVLHHSLYFIFGLLSEIHEFLCICMQVSLLLNRGGNLKEPISRVYWHFLRVLLIILRDKLN